MTLYESLDSFADIEQLITGGEAEGQYLECKSPTAPSLRGGLREGLAQATSGFANSGGGVIVWGVSTVHHAHTDLDVLTQVEPIAGARNFAQQVDRAIRLLSHPVVDAPPSRVLTPAPGASKGVVVTHIPGTVGDPVQSVLDKNFYIRTGDGFAEMPYEMLQRMFAGAAGPILTPSIDPVNVHRPSDGSWTVPIFIYNESTAVADPGAEVLVQVMNPTACERIKPAGFADISDANPGDTLFRGTLKAPTFRGFANTPGSLNFQMRKVKGYRRVLVLRVTILAHRMRARYWDFRIQLAPRKGFSVTLQGAEDLY